MEEKYIIDKERVDLLMKRASISTYVELAERSGLHQNTLTKILDGKSWQSKTAMKLAKALHCSPIDLQTLVGFPLPNLETLGSLSVSLN